MFLLDLEPSRIKHGLTNQPSRSSSSVTQRRQRTCTASRPLAEHDIHPEPLRSREKWMRVAIPSSLP